MIKVFILFYIKYLFFIIFFIYLFFNYFILAGSKKMAKWAAARLALKRLFSIMLPDPDSQGYEK